MPTWWVIWSLPIGDGWRQKDYHPLDQSLLRSLNKGGGGGRFTLYLLVDAGNLIISKYPSRRRLESVAQVLLSA